jgi:carboxyl-terminal processing protease
MRLFTVMLVVFGASMGAASGDEPQSADLASIFKVTDLIKSAYVEPVDDRDLLQQCAAEISRDQGAVAAATGDKQALEKLLAARLAEEATVARRRLAIRCIEKMVVSIDRHAEVITREGSPETFRTDLPQRGGAGLELRQDTQNTIRVVRALDDSPAQAAGVNGGERLLEIDGIPVDQLGLRNVVGRLRGEIGTPVALTLQKDTTSQPFTLNLDRTHISQPSVAVSWPEPGTLRIALTQFNAATSAALGRRVASAVTDHGAFPRGLILDLRGNSGGLLTLAVDIAGFFLADDLAVGSTRGRTSRDNKDFKTEPPPPGSERHVLAQTHSLRQAPLVVLIDGRTEAGGEIFAAALRFHKRAVLMGSPTAGFGAVQTAMAVNDDMMIKFKTSQWMLPGGALLDGHPVQPDLAVDAVSGSWPTDADPVLDAALRYIQKERPR